MILIIVYIVRRNTVGSTVKQKYDIYNMMYNDFDIIINFRNEFLLVLKYEIVIIGILQII